MKKAKPVAKAARKAGNKNPLPAGEKGMAGGTPRESVDVDMALRPASRKTSTASSAPEIERAARVKLENGIALQLRDRFKDDLHRLERFTVPTDDFLLAQKYGIFALTPEAMQKKVAEVMEAITRDIVRWEQWRQHPDLIVLVDEARELRLKQWDRPRLSDMRSNYPEYPLELVANVAAHLLNDKDYGEAATRAHGLLDACNDHLAFVAMRKHQALEMAMSLPKYCTVTRDKALRAITGTDNISDATGRYRAFFRKTRQQEIADDDEAEAAFAKELVRIESAKFSPYQIQCQREEYLRAYPKRQPKRRKK